MGRLSVFLILVVVFVAACGDDGSEVVAGRGDTDDAVEGDWVLVSGTVDGVVLDLDPQHRITMSVQGSEIGGTAACNGYGGTVSTSGGAFSVGDLSQTEMGCEPPVMVLERAFVTGLLAVDAVTSAGDTASLTGEGVAFTFERLAPVPTSELVASEWLLDTLISGETASSSTLAGEGAATLTLAADGTLSGATGCRTFEGTYVVSGDTVRFTNFTVSGECDGAVVGQDEHVVSVLGDGFTIAIDGDRLTITAAGGDGLSYRGM